MGITKSASSNIRKLTKVGGASLAVTLPMDLVRKLNWKEKQKVVVKKIPGGIQIKDWKK
ncbi:MAG: AbrB/MazE/SpoVT family DNA-binding domain-containing protein [Candidatus Paceibacterota bacterium]